MYLKLTVNYYKLFYFLIIGSSLLLFSRCTLPSPNTGNEMIPQVDSTKNSLLMKVNATYPFGCVAITEYTYPKRWEADLEHYGSLKSPDGATFQNMDSIYNALNEVANVTAPQFDKIEMVAVNDAYQGDYYFDTLAVYSLDSCKYRLPDMACYRCYYFVSQSTTHNYGVYGNLLLQDTLSGDGKLLTIYFSYGGDQHINLRYFFIDKKTIQLFDGSYYDDGCELRKSYQISVRDRGDIEVQKVSNQ